MAQFETASSLFSGPLDGSATTTITKPAGTVASDRLVVVWCLSGAAGVVQQPDGDTGWTAYGVNQHGNNSTGYLVAAGDVAATTFKSTATSYAEAGILMLRISSASSANPGALVAWLADMGSGGDLPAPSAHSDGNACIIATYLKPANTTAVGAAPAGFSDVLDYADTNMGSRFVVSQSSNVTAGDTGLLSHALNAPYAEAFASHLVIANGSGGAPFELPTIGSVTNLTGGFAQVDPAATGAAVLTAGVRSSAVPAGSLRFNFDPLSGQTGVVPSGARTFTPTITRSAGTPAQNAKVTYLDTLGASVGESLEVAVPTGSNAVPFALTTTANAVSALLEFSLPSGGGAPNTGARKLLMNIAPGEFWDPTSPWINRFNNAELYTGAADADGWFRNMAAGATGGYILWHDVDGSINGAVDDLGMWELRANTNCTVSSSAGTLTPISAGVWRVNISAGTTSNFINITSPVGGNGYFTDAKFFLSSDAAAVDAGEIVNPRYVAWMSLFSNLGMIRAMDLGRTNGNTIVNVGDIPLESSQCWTTNKGAPPTAIAKLAEKLNVDLWYCMPHQATPATMQSIWAAIWGSLSANWKANRIINSEYTNEGWNWGFQQTYWLNTPVSGRTYYNDTGVATPAANLGSNYVHSQNYAHGCIATWKAAYDAGIPANKIKRIAAPQTGWFDLFRPMLQYRDPGMISANTKFGDLIKASEGGLYAVATYHAPVKAGQPAGQYDGYANLEEIYRANFDQLTMSQWNDSVKAGIDSMATPNGYELHRTGYAAAGFPSGELQFTAYEGGTHWWWDKHKSPWSGSVIGTSNTISGITGSDLTGVFVDGDEIQLIGAGAAVTMAWPYRGFMRRVGTTQAITLHTTQAGALANTGIITLAAATDVGIRNYTRDTAFAQKVLDYFGSQECADAYDYINTTLYIPKAFDNYVQFSDLGGSKATGRFVGAWGAATSAQPGAAIAPRLQWLRNFSG